MIKVVVGRSRRGTKGREMEKRLTEWIPRISERSRGRPRNRLKADIVKIGEESECKECKIVRD